MSAVRGVLEVRESGARVDPDTYAGECGLLKHCVNGICD